MRPLTQPRRPGRDVPSDLAIEYYTQRATAALLITEARRSRPKARVTSRHPASIAPHKSRAGRRSPTLFTPRADAPRSSGVGRVSYASLQPNGQAPVAPSAITATTKVFTPAGFADASPPRALDTSEIKRVVDDYRKAAENAKAAGFDGVELHGANGYLVDQFLRDGSNKRTDAYGGSIENRTRFLAEILAALTSVFPATRVGVRFSPFSSFGDISDSNPMATFGAAITVASNAGLGYLHLVEGETGGSRELPPGGDIAALRRLFKGAYLANNGYDRAGAIEAVESGAADLIAFGKLFIANPDLVERLRWNARSTSPSPRPSTAAAPGYTDYPPLESKAA